MGLRQVFSFTAPSQDAVRTLLRRLGSTASLKEVATDFFVFSQEPADAEFTFDCEIMEGGLRSDRAGEYFTFLGVFLEALTGEFGAVTVEDA